MQISADSPMIRQNILSITSLSSHRTFKSGGGTLYFFMSAQCNLGGSVQNNLEHPKHTINA